MSQRRTALVTGGGGFLGKAITRQLLARGYAVRSLCRGDYPDLRDIGVEVVRGDVGNAGAVEAAATGCDIVFHVAAKVDMWGAYRDYYATNVRGTDHVIDACRKLGIGKLVYASTPSVVHSGGDIEGGDESLPYPTHFKAHYPHTKSIAEQRVLAANSPHLSTVALRPHLIWGPGDHQFVPQLIARAKAGRLRVVGNGTNRVDSVYIDNAAEAHVLAGERLAPGAACAGKAFFITQGEPLPAAELINRFLAAGGVAPVHRTISPRAAYAVGAVCEAIYTLLRLDGLPLMTRFLAEQLSTAHWFDISAARRDLGYTPRITLEEGMQRLAAWLRRTTSP